jgi:hypothetical protein
MKRRVLLVLVAWFVVTFIASYFGLHEDTATYPNPLPILIAIPVLLYLIWYRRSREFRAFVWSIDLRTIALVQTFRIAGVFIIPVFARTMWPTVFTRPVFVMDLAFGLTAPIVAWTMSRTPFPRNLVIWWNALGIAHLTVNLALRVLTARTWSIWGDQQVSTFELSQFPLSILVAYWVPLLIIGNIITLHTIRDAPTKNGGADLAGRSSFRDGPQVLAGSNPEV